MKPGDIILLGPKSKHPARWAKILAIHPRGDKATIQVYPEGHPQPKPDQR